MPIRIPENLPAFSILDNENVFVISENVALHQDIRPLNILIVNLMPTKIVTETQLLRLLSNTPLQVNITLLRMSSYKSTHEATHIDKFYLNFKDVKDNYYDAAIITGAPVEHLPFCEVKYWEELTTIFEWSKKNVFSTLHICWGAQAGLFYHFGIEKEVLKEKISGIYTHRVLSSRNPLTKGFDDVFMAPHSRLAITPYKKIKADKRLDIIAESVDISHIFQENEDISYSNLDAAIVTAAQNRLIFISGHIEYDRDTLKYEYFRDLERKVSPKIPINYFEDDDPQKPPKSLWSAHASLFYFNWLNLVYQETPFDLTNLQEILL